MGDLVRARDQAVRDLADHLQPTRCGGCAECAVLWAAVARAEYQLELRQAAA